MWLNEQGLSERIAPYQDEDGWDEQIVDKTNYCLSCECSLDQCTCGQED